MDENKDTIENTGMESEMSQNPVEDTQETIVSDGPVEVVEETEQPVEEPAKDTRGFADLGVEPRLLKAIEEMGFVNPMPIQEMVIPHLLEKDSDVVGLAQTGTGKTAAFGLPVLQRIDPAKRVPQALIIAPTRELCLQIAGDLADFSKYIPD